MSAVLAGTSLPPPPTAVDWTQRLDPNLGMMLNAQYGDCVIAGMGHLGEIWTGNIGVEVVIPDTEVLTLYEDIGGYVPGNPSTDNGCDEQTALKYWMTAGIPSLGKLNAYFEVDPRNDEDLDRVTDDCGAVFVGITLPNWLATLVENGGEVPGIWQDPPGADCGLDPDNGHCIILPGYDQTNRKAISWGAEYLLPRGCSTLKGMEEAYGAVSSLWIESTGKTPAGLTLADWEAQMTAIKNS